MEWENEYDANNNDHVEPAGVVAEQPWQYICIRRGSRDFQLKTHGLDVQNGWLRLGPVASQRCSDTFREKPGSCECFFTFSPCVAYKWKIQEIWVEGMVWCRPGQDQIMLVTRPIKPPMVLQLHMVEVNDASHLKVEAVKMNGDLVFEKDFKKETTFGRVKQRILQELLNKHGYTDVDAENVTMCAQGILLAKDFLRCVISKKEILATYRADGTLLNRRR